MSFDLTDEHHFVVLDMRAVFAGQPSGGGGATPSVTISAASPGATSFAAVACASLAGGTLSVAPVATLGSGCSADADGNYVCALAPPAGPACPFIMVEATKGDVAIKSVTYTGCAAAAAAPISPPRITVGRRLRFVDASLPSTALTINPSPSFVASIVVFVWAAVALAWFRDGPRKYDAAALKAPLVRRSFSGDKRRAAEAPF